jgi:LCP family protein required for cell wall assembly
VADDPREAQDPAEAGAEDGPGDAPTDRRVEASLGERPAAPRGLAARIALGTMRTAVALLSAAVLAAGAYGWVEEHRINAGATITDVIDSVPSGGPRPRDGAMDILLVGMDSRTDAQGRPLPQDVLDQLHAGDSSGELNTDTMILVHIPMDGRRAVAISFPRDSYVQIAGGFGKHKLNSAYARAKLEAARQLREGGVTDQARIEQESTVAGRKNLIKTIEDLTGGAVHIDRYAEVNLASFYQVSRVVGGIEVCLRSATRDDLSGARFPAGRQTVEGAQALAFVRQRHGLPAGDLDRIVRQQVFIGAVARKVLAGGMLTDPRKLNELVDAIQRSVVLSQGWDLTSFAEQMQDLADGKMQFRTIPVVDETTVASDGDVLVVNPQQVRAFVTGMAGDDQGSTSSSPTPTTSVPQPRARGADESAPDLPPPSTVTARPAFPSPASTPASPSTAPAGPRSAAPTGSIGPSAGSSGLPPATSSIDESIGSGDVPCVN